MAYHMTRDDFKESIDEIIYWVENKEENLCPDFEKTVYGMKEWLGDTEYNWNKPKPTLKQRKAVYNIYTKYKIEKWIKNNSTPRMISENGNINDYDYCDACMNTGRQYYCDDVFGPCIECSRSEIMNHPSE